MSLRWIVFLLLYLGFTSYSYDIILLYLIWWFSVAWNQNLPQVRRPFFSVQRRISTTLNWRNSSLSAFPLAALHRTYHFIMISHSKFISPECVFLIKSHSHRLRICCLTSHKVMYYYTTIYLHSGCSTIPYQHIICLCVVSVCLLLFLIFVAVNVEDSLSLHQQQRKNKNSHAKYINSIYVREERAKKTDG